MHTTQIPTCQRLSISQKYSWNVQIPDLLLVKKKENENILIDRLFLKSVHLYKNIREYLNSTNEAKHNSIKSNTIIDYKISNRRS